MTAQTDRIETAVLIHAPQQRVWDLISQPQYVGRWFSNAGAEIDLRPGGELTLTWDDHGTVTGRIEAVEPPSRLAYRWMTRFGSRDEPTAANSTLVEFTLATEPDGTRVTVVESGFDALAASAEERDRLLADHTQGWPIELGHLVDLAHADAPARSPR